MKRENIVIYYQRKTRVISVLVFVFSFSVLLSQESQNQILSKVYLRGKTFSMPIKNGEIESLQQSNLPKDTWTYKKLKEYKQNLGSDNIIYGSIIMPNKKETFYSYNLFAYDIKKKFYYFVAVVSYRTTGNNIEFNGSFLFTEKKGLENWWLNIANFYKSNRIKKIPKKYLFDFCPPPPFKKQ